MTSEKPHIDLLVFPDSPEVRTLLKNFPETISLLFTSGLPKNFLNARYSAAEELTIVVVPPQGPLIRFGNSSGISDGLFIDPSTGEVIEVVHGEVTSFVNSSLDQFGRTVTAFVERFPFYSREAENDEIVSAANDLFSLIDRIDPPAMVVDRFWSTRVDDVAIGDYASEDMCARHQ